MTSNWFIVGDSIIRVCICVCEREGEHGRLPLISSFILPCCDVPLILIFSSQMRAIRGITMHFNSSILNISFLWYLPLKPSQVYTLLTFMCFQVQRNISVNLSLQQHTSPMRINITCNYSWCVLQIFLHLDFEGILYDLILRTPDMLISVTHNDVRPGENQGYFWSRFGWVVPANSWWPS